MRMVRTYFASLKIGNKFWGRPPGFKKRIQLIKVQGNRAKKAKIEKVLSLKGGLHIEERPSTMLYSFKDSDTIFVCRWTKE